MSNTPTARTEAERERLARAPFWPHLIMVPLDGSKDAEAALPVASYFATVFGVEVRVVHAIPAGGADEDHGAATFEAYVAGLVTNGHLPEGTRAEVVAGAAADAILAGTSGADMIVLASHGQGGLQSALFGSVADKVVRAAKTPVVVVPVTHAAALLPVHTIVIAVDESESAAHAVALGRDFAERCGAAVTLVNAYLPTPVAAGIEVAYVPPDAGRADQDAAEAVVAEVAEPGEEHQAVLGSPVDVIAETAAKAGAELVVAGSRGRGYFSRLLLGSVSEGLMHRLDRPLLVVPTAPDETERQEPEQLPGIARQTTGEG
ncbi:MAG: universal stress protein [Dehalococcoidia bacterium]